jgi:hypothetical protein
MGILGNQESKAEAHAKESSMPVGSSLHEHLNEALERKKSFRTSTAVKKHGRFSK